MKPRVGAVLLAVAVMILMLGSAALAPIGTAVAPASSGGANPSSASPETAGTTVSPSIVGVASAGETGSISVDGSSVTVGAAAASAVPAAASPSSVHTADFSDGSLTLAPNEGPVGTTVSATSSNSPAWAHGSPITFSISGSATLSGATSCTTNSQGHFPTSLDDCEFTIASGSAGSYTVTATDNQGDTGTASFTIAFSDGSLTLAPNEGPVGTTVSATSSNSPAWAHGSPITFSISGSATLSGATSCTTNSQGHFPTSLDDCEFTIASGSAGSYTVTATDNQGDTGTASFTIAFSDGSLTLAPNEGPVGTTVSATSSNSPAWAHGSPITFSISGSATLSGATSCTTNSQGHFPTSLDDCEFTIASGSAGSYTVTATDNQGDTGTASFTIAFSDGSLTLAPNEGPVGTTVSATSSNSPAWAHGSPITFSISGSATLSGATSCTTNSQGHFPTSLDDCEFTIASGSAGSYTVTATDNQGDTGTASFTIAFSDGSLTLAPNEGPVGTTVSATSSNSPAWAHGSPITFSISGSATLSGATSCTTNSQGHFPTSLDDCEFTIASGSAGSYTVTATDNQGDTGTASFTIAFSDGSLTLAPNEGPVGTTVSATSSNSPAWAHGSPITFSISGSATLSGATSCTTNSQGHFPTSLDDCEFTIASGSAGSYTVTATDNQGDTGTASFTIAFSDGSLTLAPNEGPVGTTVSATSSNSPAWAHGSPITFSISGSATLSGATSCTTNSQGHFPTSLDDCEFTIASGSAGSYTVTATDNQGDTGTASFTIAFSDGSLTLAPNEGPVGTTVSATSSNSPAWAHGSPITFSISGSATLSGATSCTTNSQGHFPTSLDDCEFTIASGSAGSYTVTATDNQGDTGTASFTIVSQYTVTIEQPSGMSSAMGGLLSYQIATSSSCSGSYTPVTYSDLSGGDAITVTSDDYFCYEYTSPVTSSDSGVQYAWHSVTGTGDATPTTQDGYFEVTQASTQTATYITQYKITFGYADQDSSSIPNGATIGSYEQSGTSMTLEAGVSYGTTSPASDWVDAGNNMVTYETYTSGTQRWALSSSPVSFDVSSSTTLSESSYYHQFDVSFAYTTSDGTTIPSGFTLVIYTQFTSTINLFATGVYGTPSETSDWANAGTAVKYVSPVSVSSTERYQIASTDTGTNTVIPSVSGSALSADPEYYHQYYVSTGYTTSDGPAIPSEDGSVGLSAVQFGNPIAPTLSTAATSAWLDADTTWTVSPNILPASPSTERWDADNLALTGTVTSSTTISPEYWHQFDVTFAYTTVDGTPIASGTTLVSYTQFGGPLTLTTTGTYGVLSLSSDWADAGTPVTYVSPVYASANDRYVIALTDTGTHTVIASVSGSTLSADPEYAFHQFSITLQYSIVGSGSPTAPTVHYTEFSTVETTTAALAPSTSVQVWVQVGTTVAYTNPLGTSTGSHRWQVDLAISGGFSTVGSPVAGVETLNPSYFEQWDVSFAYTTSDGSTIASGTTLISYTQFGSLQTLTATGVYGEPSKTSDWADVGTAVTYNSPVPIPSNGRYIISGTDTIITSVGSGSTSATTEYWHQFDVSFAYMTSDSTTLPSVTQLVTYTQFGGTLHLSSGALPSSDWVDAGTAVTFVSPVTVSSTEQYAIASGGTVISSVGIGSTAADPVYLHQFEVTFAVSPSDSGTTSPSGTDVWEDAGSLAISASPSGGYAFASWSSSTGSITFDSSTLASTTATIGGAGTITANFLLFGLNPYSGATSTLTAGGLAGSTNYWLCFDSSAEVQSGYCVPFKTGSDGSYSDLITIPSVPNGAYYVEAWTTSSGGTSTSGTFVVVAATQFTIGVGASLAATGTYGSTPSLTAYGLKAETEYWVCFDVAADTQSSYCASFTTGSDGSYSGTITIPSMPGGTYDDGPLYQGIWTAASGGALVILVSGSFTMDPSAEALSPTSGTYGSTTTLTAYGLTPNTEYLVCFDTSSKVQSGYCVTFMVTVSAGSYSGPITIPSMPGGTYDYVEIWTAALDSSFVVQASGTFTMNPSAGALNPDSGTYGSPTTLTAYGFVPGTYYVCFDTGSHSQSSYCASFTTGSAGSFGGTISIPSMPGGTYDYVEIWSAASDGTFEAQIPGTFTMNPSAGALNPDSGTYTSPSTLMAYGLTPGMTYYVCFDSSSQSQSPYCTSFAAGPDGSYSGTITIPSMPIGPYDYVEIWSAASGGTFEAQAAGTFTMGASATLGASSGVYESTPTLTAYGLTANTPYWVCFDASSESQSSYCASFTTGPDGSYSGMVTIPSMPGGTYDYVEIWSAASGGTFEAPVTGTFTMDASAEALSLDTGVYGYMPTLTAYGLAPGMTYYVCFDASSDSQSSYCASFTVTASDGSYTGTITIPSMPGGTYDYVVIWSAAPGGTFEARAAGTFTMEPSATLTGSSGVYGSTPTLTAYGLAANTEYWVCFDSTVDTQSAYCVEFETGSDGSYSGTISIPSMPGGTYDYVEIWTANYDTGTRVLQATGQFTMGASVTISPASGPAGLPTGGTNTQVTVTAYGLLPGTFYTIYFDEYAGTAFIQATTPSPTIETDGSGSFSGAFNAPAGLTDGAYYFVDVFTTAPSFVVSASPEFEVTAITLTVSPTTGVPGPVTVSAEGLSPDTIYNVYLDTTQGVESSASYNPLGICTTDSSGALSSNPDAANYCTFNIPSGLSAGTYYVDLFQDPAPAPYIVLLYSFTVTGPTPPPATYSVTFSETGLASGTSWSVTLDGVTQLGTGTSMAFTGMANGVYSFSVGSVSGYTVSPATGSETVNGADVSQAITFTPIGPPPSTYTITFTETGMPPGAGGGVAFNGAGLTPFGSGGILRFSGLVNGSYSFTISAGAGYQLVSTTPGSPVAVNGADVSVSTAFEAVYAATFTETGLLSGTSWSVTLNGVTQSGTGSSIAFTGVVNGSYAFGVAAVSGYTVSPATGSVTVSGADASQPITFTPIAPPPSTYTITFTETGLTAGTLWSVTLNGVTLTGAGSSIAFPGMVNGSYSFGIGSVSGYSVSPATGSVTVNGADVSQAITYTPTPPSTYTVTFTETGLTAGTTWSVTLNGTTLTGAGSSIAFTAMLNGTYSFSVGAVSGYTVSPAAGSVTVNGADLSQVITFTPITPPPPSTYTVTFTETGLTTGTSWSVTFNGSTLSASAPSSVVFGGVQNGTYTYSVGAVSGYTSIPSAGVPTTTTVSGGALTVGITFASAPAPTATVPLYIFAIIAVVIAAIVIGTLVALVGRRRRKREPESGSTGGSSEFPASPPSGGSGGGTA